MTRRQRVFVGGATATAAAALALVYAWPYVAPFLLAMFLATVIDAPVTFLCERLRIGRGPAIVLVLVFVLSLLGGIVFVLVANLSAELEQLLASLPLYAAALRTFTEHVALRAETLFSPVAPSFVDALRLHPDQWTGAVQGAVKALLGALGALPEALFVVFIGGLATYFISKDRHILWKGVLRTTPPEWRTGVIRLRDEIVGGALSIVRIQFALAGLTSVASVVGLALVGVPYAWALGLLAGLLDLAPFLGPSIVLMPAAAVYLLHGSVSSGFVLLAVWMIIVGGRQWLEPHLFGAGLGLHPVTTLLALYVGVRAMGVAGFVAGPLLLIVVKALFVVAVEDRDTRR